MSEDASLRCKSKVFKVARHSIDRHRNIVMVDMFDKDHNRMSFHYNGEGEYVFDVFKVKGRFHGKTEKTSEEIRSIFQVIDILKEEGISLVYTGESEGHSYAISGE